MSNSSFYAQFQEQKQALLRGDISTVKRIASEARKKLEAKGMVKAYPLFGWIEKEWLEKAIQEGVILYHSEQYGYVIVAHEGTQEKVIGYKGRTPITETIKTSGIDGFLNFLRRYEDFKIHQRQQEFVVNQEIQSLIDSVEP